jgi:hypothetical protein
MFLLMVNLLAIIINLQKGLAVYLEPLLEQCSGETICRQRMIVQESHRPQMGLAADHSDALKVSAYS